ncbi:hypothetical protein V6N13_008972 [Hibiscus sabdariffa]
MQLVMEVSATVLASVGMAFDGEFKEMKREAGERVYCATGVSNIVSCQLCFMGTAGMVFVDRRDLHDGVADDERVGRGGGLWG